MMIEMYELPIMTWFRKKLGYLKSDELVARKAENILKKETALQDWNEELFQLDRSDIAHPGLSALYEILSAERRK